MAEKVSLKSSLWDQCLPCTASAVSQIKEDSKGLAWCSQLLQTSFVVQRTVPLFMTWKWRWGQSPYTSTRLDRLFPDNNLHFELLKLTKVSSQEQTQTPSMVWSWRGYWAMSIIPEANIHVFMNLPASKWVLQPKNWTKPDPFSSAWMLLEQPDWFWILSWWEVLSPLFNEPGDVGRKGQANKKLNVLWFFHFMKKMFSFFLAQVLSYSYCCSSHN